MTGCAPLTGGAASKTVTLASGNYLWESYERMLNRVQAGDFSTIHRAQRVIYLRAGTYRWSSCLHYDQVSGCTPGCAPTWRNTSTLTEVATGGTVYESSYPPSDTSYDHITRFGSNLWQCSTENVC